MKTLGKGCRRRAWIGAMLIGMAACPACPASTFSIAPIRVELDESHGTEALTVRNESDAAVVLQARALSWAQDGGVDSFTDTRDVIVTPPVLTLAPQTTQIIRVALRRPADASVELSYRLFLQEVPQAAPQAEQGLLVALRLSLPIFVAPSTAQPNAQVNWTSHWHDDGSLGIEAHNPGTAHLQLVNVQLAFGTGLPGVEVGAARYLLPGARASWSVKPPQGIGPSTPIHVHGRTDVGEFSAAVTAAAF
jgi:fimbrial chaperone protein